MSKTAIQNLIADGRIDDFASSLELFERMETVLRQRLKDKPEDQTLLFHLAACKRKQGKLDEALHLYSELGKSFPDNPDYPYTTAALTGELSGCVTDTISRPCPSPVVELSNFLPETTIQEMIDYMWQHKADFRPSEVGGGKKHDKGRYDPEYRNNTGLSLKGNPLKKIVRALITEQLADVTHRLGLSPFENSRIEVKLRAYHNGEYFRVHQDGGHGRLISYTYFFHPEPNRFDGGELVIFDTDTTSSNYNHSFTRIMPKSNSLFFFPSHHYHAVLPVETQDDDFMSARFVINGHVWEKKQEND